MKESNFPEEYDYTEDSVLPDSLPADELIEAELLLDEQLLEVPSDDVLLAEDIFTAEELLEAQMLADAQIPEEAVSEVLPAEDIFTGDELLHEDLTDPETGDELMAAEHAMYDAGLQHPEDAEFLFDEVPADKDFRETEDNEIFQPATPAEAEEPAPARKTRPVRKGRPKRKKGYGLFGIPHLLAAAIWLIIIVAIGTTLGRMLWVCAADVLAFGREDKDVTVSITTDDTMESIAHKLKAAGLVRYPELFLIYADLTDAEEDITTGTFTLNTVYDYHALVNQMSPRSGTRAVVEDVLIPEGYNCRQIFALLEQRGICKAADLEKWAAEGELSDYWFLEGVERGSAYCLEGFLFPDTYDFYENSTPRAALEKMLDGFEYRINDEIRAKIPLLNQHLTDMMRRNGNDEEFIAANQFDIRDVVNVSSLIEKETASNQESYRIASVIYNRLFNWGNSPRYLGIDATIIYALGGKTNLTAEDLAIDSPYNTRNHTGLPPGPIANPGLASIEAALNPETTSYYYYVLNPSTGVHDFSKTLAEHDKKVEKYLRGGNG